MHGVRVFHASEVNLIKWAVKLNGSTIIDNEPIAGCTGGALWSAPLRPGPIYLQGDHTAVQYRNIVLRPVVN